MNLKIVFVFVKQQQHLRWNYG